MLEQCLFCDVIRTRWWHWLAVRNFRHHVVRYKYVFVFQIE